jgi:hypothetical protein
VSGDLHRPTTAGPTPQPSPTVPATQAGPDRPAGSVAADDGGGLPLGIPPEHPEILVGAAFAGGVLAALILKRLGGS